MVELAQESPRPYRAQAVEAIRISHEIAGSGMDHAQLFTAYVLVVAPETSFTLLSSLAALDAAIQAAVKAEGQGTIDIFREFIGRLNDESKSKRCT